MAKKLLLNTEDKIAIVNTGENATAFRVGVGDGIDIPNSVVDEQNAELIIENTEIGNKIEVLSRGKNLFNREWLPNKIISSFSGDIIDGTGAAFDFIQVKSNTNYIFYHAMNVFEYDKNYNYIGQTNKAVIANGSSFRTSENTKYLRGYRGNNLLENPQLEQGTKQTNYEPYKGQDKKQILCNSNITKTNIKLYKNGHVFISNADGTENTTITKTTHLVEVEE